MTHGATSTLTSRRSGFDLACYALPALPVQLALYAVSLVIPGYFAQVTGVTAASIGLVLILTRVADVGFDLAVGYLSDITPLAWGGRKAWIVVGSAILATSFIAVTAVRPGVGELYLFFVLLFFYLGWSILVVPHTSWGSAIAGGPDDRARVFAYRVGAGYLGSVAFALLPALPIFATHAYGGETLRFAGWTVAALVLISVPLATWRIGHGATVSTVRPDPADALRALRGNRPLAVYIAVSVLNGFANGMFIAIVYLYQSDYLGLGEFTWLVILVYILASLAMLPPWTWAMRRIGKARAWALGLGISAASYLPLSIVTPGPQALSAVLVIFAIAGGAFSVANIATPALLGDVIDYEGFRSRRDLTGTLFAFQALIEKFNLAVGGGAAFLVIGAFGYTAGAAPTAPTLFGLQLAHIYLPALLNIAAIVLLWRFPLRERHLSLLQRWRARTA